MFNEKQLLADVNMENVQNLFQKVRLLVLQIDIYFIDFQQLFYDVFITNHSSKQILGPIYWSQETETNPFEFQHQKRFWMKINSKHRNDKRR